jgi:hypothetical protein
MQVAVGGVGRVPTYASRSSVSAVCGNSTVVSQLI